MKTILFNCYFFDVQILFPSIEAWKHPFSLQLRQESLTHLQGCGFGKNIIYDKTLNNIMRSGSHKIMLENINEAKKKKKQQRAGKDRKVTGN